MRIKVALAVLGLYLAHRRAAARPAPPKIPDADPIVEARIDFGRGPEEPTYWQGERQIPPPL